MDLLYRALLLLCAAAFVIADSQGSSKYGKFEGLTYSVEEELHKQMSENRRISRSRTARNQSSREDDITVRELVRLLRSLEDSGISVTELVRLLRRLEAGELSLGVPSISTGDPVTKQTATSTPMTVGPSASHKAEQKMAKSTEADSSSSVSYDVVSPVTENTAEYAGSSEDSEEGSRDPQSFKRSYGIGSTKGVPGEQFPDYTDIPLTDFSCSDKPTIPGFYADLETNCQVFHVCWPNRRETFLCPVGTTFNQAILTCDYWYSNNCSLAPRYYSVNMGDTGLRASEDESESSIVDVLSEITTAEPSEAAGSSNKIEPKVAATALSFASKILPVKAQVAVYPDSEESAESSSGEGDFAPEDVPFTNDFVSNWPHPPLQLDAASAQELPQGDAAVRPLWSLEYRMDQALTQAQRDLDDYFSPLLRPGNLDRDMVRYREAYTALILEMRHFLRLFSPVDKFVPGTEILPGKDSFFISKAQKFRAWFVAVIKRAVSKLLFDKWYRRPYFRPPKFATTKKSRRSFIAKPLTEREFKAMWQLYKIALRNMQEEPSKQWKTSADVLKATKMAILKNYFRLFKLNSERFLYYLK